MNRSLALVLGVSLITFGVILGFQTAEQALRGEQDQKPESEVQIDQTQKTGQLGGKIGSPASPASPELQLDSIVVDGREITGSKTTMTQGSSMERVEDLKLLYPPKYTDPDGNPTYIPSYWFENRAKMDFEGKRELTGFMFPYLNSTLTCDNFKDLAKEYSWSEKYENYIYEEAIKRCITYDSEEDE